MNRFIAISCILVISIKIATCQTTEERKITSFDKIMVSNEMKVFLSKGNEEHIKVISSGIETNDIITKVNGKTLDLDFSRGIHKEANVEIYVTYKEVREVNISASSKVSFQDTLKGDKVIFSAISGSELTADLQLKTADIKVSQGATIRLNGRIGSYESKVTTGGILSAIELKADSIFITVSSTGVGKVFATELIDASVKTGSTLTLTGNPKSKKINTGIGATINEN